MTQKTIKVGILSFEDFQKRTLAIARGEYKPKKNEPKIWFESLRSMAQVLSPENLALLRLIANKKPQSLAELAKHSQRKKSNLSRTMKKLHAFGIVELTMNKGRLVPKVKALNFKVEFGIHLQAA